MYQTWQHHLTFAFEFGVPGVAVPPGIVDSITTLLAPITAPGTTPPSDGVPFAEAAPPLLKVDTEDCLGIKNDKKQEERVHSSHFC